MPLRRIKQTSKIMLIEEFCISDDVPDLYTMLRNEDVKEKSEFLKGMEEKLEVRSYEEFINKFMPTVWEWYEKSDDSLCPVRFCYSLEKPNHVNAHEIKLSSNEFYKMVMDLYSRKGVSGESNLSFDYSQVAELLSPTKILENAKQLRKDLQYNYNKMLELGEGAKVEKNKCIKRIKEVRKEIVSQYRDSLTGKIKLALADTESKLAALPEKKDNDNVSDNGAIKALPCKVSFDSEGDLKVEMVEVQDNHVTLIEAPSDNKPLAEIIRKDFDKYSGENNDYIKEIIVSNYCANNLETGIAVLDRQELIEKRDMYTEIFKNSQEQFIRAISSAVEKMLNVKVFFEQACANGQKLPAPLVVTNCKVNKLIGDENTKERFEYLINELKKEIDEHRIWFAIIPAIGDADFIENPDMEENIDDDLDFDEPMYSDLRTTDGDSLVSLDAAKSILGILKRGRILSFFNFRANEKTGFAKLNSDIIEAYRKKLESINGNEYAVFTYPNFTILPKKETSIEIGKISIGNGEEKTEFLDIPGIYVDASYVAAGLVVASQNPSYLENKKYKVNKNNPCVRFDFEQDENRFIMLTNMNREGKGAWASEVEENIGKDKFGFCFCGNTKYYKNERVKNTYVYVVRTMKKDKNGNYEPLYTRLTMDFIMQYLQTENLSIGSENSYKRATINNFIEKTVKEWKREDESEKKANNILHEDEDVTFSDNTIKVKFANAETEVSIEIEKEE